MHIVSYRFQNEIIIQLFSILPLFAKVHDRISLAKDIESSFLSLQ